MNGTELLELLLLLLLELLFLLLFPLVLLFLLLFAWDENTFDRCGSVGMDEENVADDGDDLVILDPCINTEGL